MVDCATQHIPEAGISSDACRLPRCAPPSRLRDGTICATTTVRAQSWLIAPPAAAVKSRI